MFHSANFMRFGPLFGSWSRTNDGKKKLFKLHWDEIKLFCYLNPHFMPKKKITEKKKCLFRGRLNSKLMTIASINFSVGILSHSIKLSYLIFLSFLFYFDEGRYFQWNKSDEENFFFRVKVFFSQYKSKKLLSAYWIFFLYKRTNTLIMITNVLT